MALRVHVDLKRHWPGHALRLLGVGALEVRTNLYLELTKIEPQRILVNGVRKWQPVHGGTGGSTQRVLDPLVRHRLARGGRAVLAADRWYWRAQRLQLVPAWPLWCRAWWRWLEYLRRRPQWSSSSRDKQRTTRLMSATACATTMLWVETRPLPTLRYELQRAEGRTYEVDWRWAKDTVLDRLVWHHLLGYAVGGDVRDHSRQLLPQPRGARKYGRVVAAFVDWSVWGSLVLFSLFGVTQLVQQADPYGPSWYWVGEGSYVFLSFTAKAFLVLLAA